MKNLIIVILSFILATDYKCQWSNNPNINTAICTAVKDQFIDQIISDGAGGAIITWEDFRNGSNYDVYVQRINAAGIIQWIFNGTIITSLANDQTAPKIISDGSGGVIIVWTDYRGGNYSDIYAQKINANGTAQWTANGIPICTAANSQYNSALVSNGAGGAIITWQDKRDGVLDIYAQHINSSGTVSWTTNGIPICTSAGIQENPAIAGDGTSGAFITWQDNRKGTLLINDYDIYTQRINASGSVLWADNGISICDFSGNQVNPVIINDNTNGVIITWVDVRNGIDLDIYAQRLSVEGIVLWTNNGVAICSATDSQVYPFLVDDGAGGAIITWYDYRAGEYDVYTQRINMNGNVMWTTDGVPISTEVNAQMSPDIISDGQGGAIIVWHDYRDNGNRDVYAQLINNNGIVQWIENGLQISTAQGDQYSPAITSDGNGGAIIVWWDYRSGWTSDIYAQQVNHYGQLGIVTDIKDNIDALPELFSLEQNYPNPFNPSTTISWQSPVGSHQSIKIFDVLGNEIAILVNEEKSAGAYEIEFDASKLSSGVYFYQLKAGEYLETKKMILLR